MTIIFKRYILIIKVTCVNFRETWILLTEGTSLFSCTGLTDQYLMRLFRNVYMYLQNIQLKRFQNVEV
jgi:hypothetical protein